MAAVKLKIVSVQVINEKKWIPFAPSIAAALISVFMIGCLQPV
jgi:prepilin signal peptidase PulO-like enzyme (type II secretory pathway)